MASNKERRQFILGEEARKTERENAAKLRQEARDVVEALAMADFIAETLSEIPELAEANEADLTTFYKNHPWTKNQGRTERTIGDTDDTKITSFSSPFTKVPDGNYVSARNETITGSEGKRRIRVTIKSEHDVAELVISSSQRTGVHGELIPSAKVEFDNTGSFLGVKKPATTTPEAIRNYQRAGALAVINYLHGLTPAAAPQPAAVKPL